MPTYRYLCTKCGNGFEANRSIDQRKEATCPRCNYSASLRPSAPAIHFKGSGWTPKGK